MRFCLYILILCLPLSQCASAGTNLAWFTDASIENSTRLAQPTGAPALVSGGTVGNCLDLTQPVALTNVTLSQVRGTISFWLRPKWNGASGINHKILRIGEPSTTSDGLLIEINKDGILRYVMAGSGKVTITRADVSSWKSGEWHHVQVGWIDKDGTPTGLPIWIDKVAVASAIFGGTQYMNHAGMQDKNIYVGDASSNAFMDELIFRDDLTAYCWNNTEGGTPIAYRDYFRTAPYTAIQITNAPQRVNSDTRVVAGYKKQFGVIATKTVNADTGTTTTEYITNSDGPTDSQWDGWDAKPYITWTSSSTSKATVDTNGLATGVATTTSPITLTAKFRGMTATYSLNVISSNQPDLDIMYVERTPKYRRSTKVWPDVGEQCTSIIHYGNFGYQTSAATTIKWELIPDLNNDFDVDPEEVSDSKTISRTFDVAGLPQGQTGWVTTTWSWPSYPVFIRVTIDPDNTVSELCEANNQRCDLNNARSTHWGYGDNDNQFTDDWNGKVMNLVGSFSDYDWCQANVERWRGMLRETILPTTSSNGIQESVRVDMFHTKSEYLADHNNPNGSYWEGGFEEMWDSRMTLSPGNIHEMGHNTFGLSDLYGHGLPVYNMFLKDVNGNHYGGTPYYPVVSVYDNFGPWSAATFGNPDACGAGYPPLMVNNHLWLDRESAGIIQYQRQTRKGIPDNQFGIMVPNENKLQIYDANDNPLSNARVYIYQDVNTNYFINGNKYYPDRPKFIITDDGTGTYTIPKTTCQYWDDPGTDYVEGASSSPQPFYHYVGDGTYTQGPSWQVGEMLLLKIVGDNGQVEFQTLPLTEATAAFLSGNTSSATYKIRTSLLSPQVTPAVVPPFIPSGSTNYKPLAKVKYNGTTYSNDFSVSVPYSASNSTTITLDGSVSMDPEDYSLEYRWDTLSGAYRSASATITVPAGTAVGDYDQKFYVIDGLRYSNLRVVTIRVQLSIPTTITGTVTDKTGQTVAGAIVGIKKSPYATADANYYVTTNAYGVYSYSILGVDSYYVAAWMDGWEPTKDSVVTLGDTQVIANLQLTDPAGTQIGLTSQKVAASSCASTSKVSNAIDGDLTIGWKSASYPSTPVYYYVDLGGPTDISWLSLYRYQPGYIWGDYQIDIMRSGVPLDPTSWLNNSTVQNVYSATQTMHGYQLPNSVAQDSIRLDLAAVRGIRFGLSNIWGMSNYTYEMKEIKLWTNNPTIKISDIKSQAINSSCKLSYKEVTATGGGGVISSTCYVEEPDRSSGLLISLGSYAANINIGDLISVNGTLKKMASGEKFIAVSSVQTVAGIPTIKALGMNNLSAATGNKIAGGLLARVWGKVDTVSTTYFTISTGSKASIKVNCGTIAKPAKDKLVVVKGIISTDGTNPTILMRAAGDWTEIPK